VGGLKKKTIFYNTVCTSFPSNVTAKCLADTIVNYSNSSLGIAILQLQQDLPEQTSVANLSGEVIEGRHFKSFRFRKNHIS
jgi:hypothetical protein